jgi:hypothetical protein
MQVIVYSTGAVGCAVVTPAPGQDINAVAERDVPTDVASLILDDSALPSGSSPLAWVLGDGKITVDAATLARITAPPVPDVISDRQFFQQLAIDGDITQDEALAAVQTGTLPDKLAAVIAALPASQQFAAKMLCCGATEFRRSNPVVSVLGQALGKDAAALDAIWIAAAVL